jgi:hypothetical protein
MLQPLELLIWDELVSQEPRDKKGKLEGWGGKFDFNEGW